MRFPPDHLDTPAMFVSRHWALSSLLALLALGAAGCASTPKPTTNGSGADASLNVQDAAGEAARQPFRDIGFMKRQIPPALARIADPYAEPSGPGCVWLKYELGQLDAALGTEVAIMPVESHDTMGARSGRAATTATRNMIRSAGNSLVPARGVIRFISGAENSDTLFLAATERGKVRRGYLKGLSEARNCS